MKTQPHAERAHAKLSPSSAARWMTCPGSVVTIPIFEEKYPSKRDGSRHSSVGTIAHEVAECYLLKKPVDREALVSANMHGDDETLSDDEWEAILGHMLAFREYVRGLMDEDDLLLVEKRVTMNQVNSKIYGTADVIIYKRKTKTLITVDLKYGMSKVEVADNPQLLLYLVGADNFIITTGNKAESYEAHIYQPRVPGGIGFVKYSRKELKEFIWEAQVAFDRIEEGEETRVPSDKGCNWCPAYGSEMCPESANWISNDVLSLLDEMDIDEMSLVDLTGRFLKFAAAKKWMTAVEKHLTSLAEDGKVDGIKLVEGRGSNECIDPEAIEFIVGDAAFKPPALKSVTELKKVVGSKNFDSLLSDCFRKRPGRATLVSIDDKRDAITNNADLLSELDDLE